MTRQIALALLGLSIAVAPAAAQSDFRACLAGLQRPGRRQGRARRGLRRRRRRRAARHEDPRADGQPARVQDADLGLSRLPRRRRAGRGRPRRDAQMERRRWRRPRAASASTATSSPASGASSRTSARTSAARPLVQSLATLSCVPNRRQGYFRGEFFATLQIIEPRRHPARAASPAPGPAPSAIPSSCPRPSCGSRSTSTATGGATSSIRCRTRSARRRTSSGRPAGSPACPGATRSSVPESFNSGLAGPQEQAPGLELGRDGRDPHRRPAAVRRLPGRRSCCRPARTARPSW